MRTVKTDQTGQMLAHSHFVGFVMSRLIFTLQYHTKCNDYSKYGMYFCPSVVTLEGHHSPINFQSLL